ncbi:Not1 N-terminal domain, CCR4-Not complex component-domain-containing protein, partial [Hyaloraphidium curvatum]
EIDRALKRVSEGVAEFEETMEKLNAAANLAQKEKYEGELKKQIKKLQRERDQIKTWLTSNEVKDKTILLENRKLIEHQMERFKAVERELKTKAYSREGLSAAAKMDPQEKEKAELGNWISESVDRLSAQVDKYEAEAELLQAAAKKSKKADSAKVEKLTQLEKQVERHKNHMTKLEIVLRMLENGNLTVEEVQGLKEDVDYYIETAENGDYPEDESFYDDLNLDEAEVFGFTADDDGSGDDEDEKEASVASPKEKEAPESKTSTPSSAVGSPQKKEVKPSAPAPPPPKVAAPPPAKVPAVTAAKPTASALPPRQPFTAAVRAPAVVPAPPPVVSTAGRGYSAVAAATTSTPDSASSTPVGASDEKKPAVPVAPGRAPPPEPAKNLPPGAAGPPARPPGSGLPPPAANVPPTAPAAALPPPQAAQLVTSPTPSSVTSMSPQLNSSRPSSSSPAPATPTVPPQPVPKPAEPAKEEAGQGAPAQPQPPPAQPPQDGAENRLPPSLADLVESFEAAKARSELPQDASFSRVMLESSFPFIPDSMDWEKPKNYVPKNPYPTPLYYPQSPPSYLEDPSIFEKFDVDTLFFVFYYQQGTYAQYLAARELKRQSWRFHKKYLTWFQRHEEPKAITDEYEQGTYIYFDYEGAWCQRKKSEFRFEYQFLEDLTD